ncbi:hypothetical protein NKE72_08020 [Streptococcus suis]|uniref:hypothetical protein n=2 Tax=Streptococcus suis TaxID=1307 RepID=UPI00209B8072|nr:hypothetical protein [Streptococcus suis]MCO8214064.1 hypothetical protein [Streptococcus suis]MCO8239956.1 hypothetical protein [Streptococcus suis]
MSFDNTLETRKIRIEISEESVCENMKTIKSIGLAMGTLLLTLLIQFPAYVGITAFQERVLLKLAVMTGLDLAILALLSVIRRGMVKNQVFSREKLNIFKIVGMTALVFTGQTFLNLLWQYLGLSPSDSIVI